MAGHWPTIDSWRNYTYADTQRIITVSERDDTAQHAADQLSNAADLIRDADEQHDTQEKKPGQTEFHDWVAKWEKIANKYHEARSLIKVWRMPLEYRGNLSEEEKNEYDRQLVHTTNRIIECFLRIHENSPRGAIEARSAVNAAAEMYEYFDLLAPPDELSIPTDGVVILGTTYRGRLLSAIERAFESIRQIAEDYEERAKLRLASFDYGIAADLLIWLYVSRRKALTGRMFHSEDRLQGILLRAAHYYLKACRLRSQIGVDSMYVEARPGMSRFSHWVEDYLAGISGRPSNLHMEDWHRAFFCAKEVERHAQREGDGSLLVEAVEVLDAVTHIHRNIPNEYSSDFTLFEARLRSFIEETCEIGQTYISKWESKRDHEAAYGMGDSRPIDYSDFDELRRIIGDNSSLLKSSFWQEHKPTARDRILAIIQAYLQAINEIFRRRWAHSRQVSSDQYHAAKYMMNWVASHLGLIDDLDSPSSQ